VNEVQAQHLSALFKRNSR